MCCSTSLKYSSCTKATGTRLMVLSDVALGRICDVTKCDVSLKSPPRGYDSVHGVRNSNLVNSEFEDDEFAIYDTAQQRLKYLVEFSVPGK